MFVYSGCLDVTKHHLWCQCALTDARCHPDRRLTQGCSLCCGGGGLQEGGGGQVVHPARMLATRQVVLQVGLAGGGYATCWAEELQCHTEGVFAAIGKSHTIALQCHIVGMFAAMDESHMMAWNSLKVYIRKRFGNNDGGKAVFAARKTKEGKAREAKKESKDEKIAKRKQ